MNDLDVVYTVLHSVLILCYFAISSLNNVQSKQEDTWIEQAIQSME